MPKEFVCNLERFGFVPPGPGYEKGLYENKGTPNSSRMSSVCGIIFRAIFSCYTRSLHGMESKKIFSSLHMTDGLKEVAEALKEVTRGLVPAVSNAPVVT